MTDEILNEFKGLVQNNVPLAMYSWLQMGGMAEYFAEPRSEDDLLTVLRICHEKKLPIRVLGAGSNVLIQEQGVPGLVLRLSAPVFCDINVEEQTVEAGAGTRFGAVVTTAVYNGLAGLEGLIGIPGTVGGIVHQNTVSSDGHIGEWVDRIRVATFAGEIKVLEREDLVFDHHNCNIGNAVILSVRFALEEEQANELTRRMQKNWIIRKKSDPSGFLGSARLFRDIRGTSPAEMIEMAGLKGTRIGGASISERNANYLQIEPECSSSDIKRLINLVKSQVRDHFEVELELDLEIW